MSLPPNEVFTAFSFVGFLMCAIPFYWHFQARNVGTCLYMAWTGLGCLIRCINSIVWNKNMINRAPVYCDISSRVQVALSSAIPACALCIQRRLYKCTTMTTGGATREEKRRDVVVDLLIGIGIPILQIVLTTLYLDDVTIYEDIGPEHHAVDTPAAYPLYFVWPVAIGTVSFFYSGKIKRQFKDMPVISSGSGINRSLYIRLMLLSSVEILGTIPLGWTLVLCAFLFFAFFGLAEEARKHYRLVYTSLANRLGYSTSSNTTCSSNGYAVQQTALA
ncbi:pheromone A receptor-domain-containing protein [Lactifluus volemus]|nr:pheromone A receptor-domain-containing protein [Lactifluus volemus]